MAVNYKVVETAGEFAVIENRTGHVIRKYSSHPEAKKMMKHLNLGGGFDGFSPNFLFNDPKTLLNSISENM